MKLVKRTAAIVIPKQPYIDWANSLDDDVKFEDNSLPEHTIFHLEEILDYLVETIEIIKPHFGLSSKKSSIAGTA